MSETQVEVEEAQLFSCRKYNSRITTRKCKKTEKIRFPIGNMFQFMDRNSSPDVFLGEGVLKI